ncbi:hypothetical protein K1719_018974 [Acacia pycnantha]|nr:hypothetical protein K1719_018974 [Acacia pycnantha]
MIGVSNGLVCLAKERGPFKVILWNPTIQKYAWLPLLTLTWDEKLSLQGFGFGFDGHNNDFKVVNIVFNDIDYNIEFDSAWVFSYVTWSWKRLICNIPPPYMNILRRYSHVLCNGMLHWIVWHKEEARKYILTFDLTHEVFGVILFPDGARINCLNTLVTTGADSLLLIQEAYVYDVDHETDEEVKNNFFSIWIMKQIGNHTSWTNIFSTTGRMDPNFILGARNNNAELILDMGDGQISRYRPTTLTNVITEAMKNSVFFHYHNESLYLLEKGEAVDSY